MSADLQRIIRIVFQGDNQTQRAFGEVSRGLDQMETMVRSVTGPMSEMADKALKVQAALTALGTAGVAFSVAKFKDFEDTMLKVAAIMGATEPQYEQLTELTKELGSSTRFTAQEAAEGLEFLALAGVEFEDAMETLPQILKLAQAAAVDLGTAADLVTNIMAGYNIEVEKTEATTDVLTATFTNANVSLSELGEAMKTVGPIAASLEMPIEDTAAVIGKLGDAGFKGSEGGTALRNILLGLADPGSSAQRIFRELGIDVESLGIEMESTTSVLEALGVKVKDAGGNVRPFADIMEDLDEGLGRIPDSADRAALLIEAFGRRGGPQMAALLSQGSGSVDDLIERIQSLSGITDQVAEQMESGIGGALRTLRSSFDAIGLEIGDAAAEYLDPAVRSIGDLFRVIAAEIGEGALDPMFDEFGTRAERFSTQIDRIAKALPKALEDIDYSRLIEGLDNLADSVVGIFKAIFQDLDPGDADDLQIIIQDLTDAMGGLADVVAGIIDEWRPVAAFLGDLIQKFGELDRETLEYVGGLLGAAQKIEVFADKLGFLKGQLALFGIEMGYQQDELTRLGWYFDKFAKDAGDAGTSLGVFFGAKDWFGAIYDALDALDGAVGRVFSRIDEWVNKTGDTIRDLVNKLPFINIEVDASTEGFDAAAAEVIEKTKELESAVEIRVETDLHEAAARASELTDVITNELKKRTAGDAAKVIEATDFLSDEIDRRKAVETAIELTDFLSDEIEARAQDKAYEIPIELQVAELEAQSREVVAQIEATSDIVRESIQWKAQLDIAEVEANAKVMEAAFDSVAATIESTGDVMLGLLDLMGDADIGLRGRLETQMRDEAKMREEAHSKQMAMLDAQINLMDERARAVERGDAMIQIDGQGLQPHLEAFMWEVLAAIQVRVNEEGMDMLLGTST